MANKIRKCIPVITVRAGKVKRPKSLILGEVLNYVDTAGARQLQIIYNACGQRVVENRATRTWQATNGKAGRATV